MSEARLELVEVVWALTSPRGRVLTCGLYRTAAGIELRIAYPEDDLVRSEVVRSVDAGRLRAALLRGELLGAKFLAG